jgi:catalase
LELYATYKGTPARPKALKARVIAGSRVVQSPFMRVTPLTRNTWRTAESAKALRSLTRQVRHQLAVKLTRSGYNHRDGNDDYTQAGNLFRLFSAEQKQRLFNNIAAAMQGVPDEIKRRQIALFAKCDPAYGAGVAKAVKVEPSGDDRLKATSATDEREATSTAA